MTPYQLKALMSALFGTAFTYLAPAYPIGAACTVMVIADVITARRLAARLGKKTPSKRQQLKFSSARFGRAVKTLLKIYLTLAAALVVENGIGHDLVPLTRLCGAIICFWQGVSILENEASCNPHPWARHLQKRLADKTKRYLEERF